MKKDPLKIAFGSATPVFMDDQFTIKEYLFHIRLGGNKRRMCFRYDCSTRSIISHTPIERPVNEVQREKLLQYFRVFVGKRKKRGFAHIDQRKNLIVKKLKPLEEFNVEQKQKHFESITYPQFNGLECPECKEELMDLDEMILVSFPAQRNVGCSKCSYRGYRIC